MGTLRVISGTLRGRRLVSVPGDTTRPITDRVKESLFDIIGGDIRDAAILDLFGGTGAVGIEAISRGAASVRFIDLHPKAVATIKQNLATTGVANQAEVFHGDAFAFLGKSPDRVFDYIYIAPPQYKEMWKRALLAVDASPGWLSGDGWVIVQIHPTEFGEIALQHLEEFDQRKYGSTLLVFYALK